MASQQTAAAEPKKKEGLAGSQSQSAAHVQIPTESSPYVQYTDLEDYKTKAYGTTGHLPVVDRPHHGGATDAPTPSGGGLPDNQAPKSTSTT